MELNLINSWMTNLLQFCDKPIITQTVSNLLKKGADVNSRNRRQQTYLHYKIPYKYEMVAEMLVSHGGDINAQDVWGRTPLYMACSNGSFPDEALHFLMRRGADPFIETNCSIIPLAVLSPRKQDLLDVIFDYTFGDSTEITVKLPWLIKGLVRNLPAFRKLCDKSFHVTWTPCDLTDLCTKIPDAKPGNLALFLDVFEDVVAAMFDNIKTANPISDIVKNMFWYTHGGCRMKRKRYFALLQVIFKSRTVSKFVERLQINDAIIAQVIEGSLQDNANNLDDLTDLVARMLKEGVHLSFVDVYMAGTYSKTSEMYHILSEAEIIPIAGTVLSSWSIPSEIILKYDMYISPSKIINYINERCRFLDESSHDVGLEYVDYFCDPGINETVLNNAVNVDKVQERINRLPKVPSLLQLSRDACRKQIIKCLDYKTNREFRAALDRLPIGEWTKRILCFQFKLY
jgi:hypothetical protein